MPACILSESRAGPGAKQGHPPESGPHPGPRPRGRRGAQSKHSALPAPCLARKHSRFVPGGVVNRKRVLLSESREPV